MGKKKDEVVGSVGHCIYCPNIDGPFTDEHILPSGLNGYFVLEDASCISCQSKINSEIETPFMQGMFKEARYRRDIGGRRKSKRPKTLRALKPTVPGTVPPGQPTSKSSDWTVFELPYERHPGLIVLPVLDLPGYLRGLDLENSGDRIHICDWIHNEKMNGNAKEIIAVELTFNNAVFFRFLAKTAHGWAVAKYGISNFKPYLLDLIQGKNLKTAAYFIGGIPMNIPAENIDFRLDWQTVPVNGKKVILILVRIFFEFRRACLSDSGWRVKTLRPFSS